MGEMVQLHAKDGHALDAYAVQPGVPATAGLVIVQEIFGVNAHIRDVADRYAEDGFVTIAPAIFDRIEPGVELGNGDADRQRAMALLGKFDMEKAVDDIAAAVGYYGGKITQYLGERPKVPLMLHFGEQDQHIPQSEIDAIAKAYPGVPIYTYPAGHGFNRDGSAGYSASSATRARARTLEFLREHLR